MGLNYPKLLALEITRIMHNSHQKKINSEYNVPYFLYCDFNPKHAYTSIMRIHGKGHDFIYSVES